MDPETLAFLKLVSKSLLVGFIWLAITCIFALIGDNAFINGAIRKGNVLFYIWFVASVLALVKIYRKMWNSKSLEH